MHARGYVQSQIRRTLSLSLSLSLFLSFSFVHRFQILTQNAQLTELASKAENLQKKKEFLENSLNFTVAELGTVSEKLRAEERRRGEVEEKARALEDRVAALEKVLCPFVFLLFTSS
jgi:septal ring factor EnvC (AmiA/AmiB activator)